MTLVIERILLVNDVAPVPVLYRAGVVTSLPFIIGLTYGGYWLANSDLPAERYPRIVGWIVVSMIGFSLLINGIVLTMERTAWHLSATRWAASIGGCFGVIIGAFEAYAIESRINAEQVRTQKQRLERQKEQLDRFTSVVSHDLRNPLHVAQGRLELARAECESDHLDDVAVAHERMERLIEELLTLARQGETVNRIEPVVLSDVVETCWQNVETASATLVTKTDRRVRADPNRLQQLFENLIRNAVQHSDGAVTITIGDSETGFYVEDDGPGIPPDERDRVFEPGYSTSEEGSGFGLQIVKQVIDSHGWDIHVTDGTEGGVRFEVTGVESE